MANLLKNESWYLIFAILIFCIILSIVPDGDIRSRYYDENNGTGYTDFRTFRRKVLNFGIVLPFIETKSLCIHCHENDQNLDF